MTIKKNHHTAIATRKAHRCSECGRRIPIGERYWASDCGRWREHTNCEDFKDQPELPAGYNQNRSLYRTLENRK